MQMLQDQFNVADTNGDGQLSYEEAVVAILGLTRDQFNTLDTNGDGLLSIEELGGEEEGGCGCCKRTPNTKIDFKRLLGDWLLVGLSLLVLISLANSRTPYLLLSSRNRYGSSFTALRPLTLLIESTRAFLRSWGGPLFLFRAQSRHVHKGRQSFCITASRAVR
jgi:hypothetical protein